MQTEDVITCNQHGRLGLVFRVLRPAEEIEGICPVKETVAVRVHIGRIGKCLHAESAVFLQQRIIGVGRRQALDRRFRQCGLQPELRVGPVVEQRSRRGSRRTYGNEHEHRKQQRPHRRSELCMVSFHEGSLL